MTEQHKTFSIDNQNRFYLSPDFMSHYFGQQPKWGPLGYVTYKRTYARELSPGRTEEFADSLARVINGDWSVLAQHMQMIGRPIDMERAQRKAQEMYKRAWEFKWLPPGRSLWFMGTPALERLGSVALNNCAFVSTIDVANDFAEPFCVLMDYLMLGVGVGFDVRGAGKRRIIQPYTNGSRIFVVQDTRESWVDALRVILEAFAGQGALPAKFDYSQVRPAGVPIKTFGGTASGPGPLDELLTTAQRILRECVGKLVDSALIVDLCNLIGRCVVAGNVRRSSEIAIGGASDEQFMRLKDYSLYPQQNKDWRWASNNSVMVDHQSDFSALAAQTVSNGEPGYFWLDTARAYGRMADAPNWKDADVLGLNPCGEITLENNELCNLVEVFPANHDNLCDFKRTLKLAYVHAKIVSLIPAHNESTWKVIQKNRRIGVSLSGIFAWYQRFGRRECVRWMNEGYKYLEVLDAEYSEWMQVNRSKKLTTVKPSGTVSLLVGHEGGMRAPTAIHYLRRIRMLHDSPLVDACKNAGHHVEQDVASPRTMVVSFPVKAHGTRTAKDVSLWEQAAMFTDLQKFWSDNSVSATLMFQNHEKDQVRMVLEHHADTWKAVSFLPLQDHGYVQAPYEAITEQQYSEAVAQLKPLQLNESQHEQDDKYCSGDLCEVRIGA